jgi:hypothetical protein
MTTSQTELAAEMAVAVAGAGVWAVSVAARTDVTLKAAIAAMNSANAASRTRLRRDRRAISSKRVVVYMVCLLFLVATGFLSSLAAGTIQVLGQLVSVGDRELVEPLTAPTVEPIPRKDGHLASQ